MLKKLKIHTFTEFKIYVFYYENMTDKIKEYPNTIVKKLCFVNCCTKLCAMTEAYCDKHLIYYTCRTDGCSVMINKPWISAYCDKHKCEYCGREIIVDEICECIHGTENCDMYFCSKFALPGEIYCYGHKCHGCSMGKNYGYIYCMRCLLDCDV